MALSLYLPRLRSILGFFLFFSTSWTTVVGVYTDGVKQRENHRLANPRAGSSGLAHVHKCSSRGYLTIGFGHKLTDDEVSSGLIGGSVPWRGAGPEGEDAISSEDAHRLFEQDWSIAQDRASRLDVFEQVPPLAQDVLAEMVFQLGLGGVSKFRGMLAALERRDFATAAQEMRRSRWMQQTPSRCEQLAGFMESCGSTVGASRASGGETVGARGRCAARGSGHGYGRGHGGWGSTRQSQQSSAASSTFSLGMSLGLNEDNDPSAHRIRFELRDASFHGHSVLGLLGGGAGKGKKGKGK